MSEAASTHEGESLKTSAKNAKAQVEGLKELVPQQLSDELKLATTLLKSKGISLGMAAAMAAAALVIVLLFVVSLVITLVNVVALWLPGWAAGLVVAAFFLIVAAILGLVGYRKVKKALPLTPDAAIRGIRHDIGVLKEGSSFDESSLDEPRKKAEDDDAEKAEKEKEPKAPAPSADELILRTRRRRRQIQALRDNLEESVRGPKDKIDRARRFADQAGSSVSNAAAKARSFVNPASVDGEQTEQQHANQERMERAKPFALMATGAAVLLGIVRRLLRKNK